MKVKILSVKIQPNHRKQSWYLVTLNLFVVVGISFREHKRQLLLNLWWKFTSIIILHLPAEECQFESEEWYLFLDRIQGIKNIFEVLGCNCLCHIPPLTSKGLYWNVLCVFEHPLIYFRNVSFMFESPNKKLYILVYQLLIRLVFSLVLSVLLILNRVLMFRRGWLHSWMYF